MKKEDKEKLGQWLSNFKGKMLLVDESEYSGKDISFRFLKSASFFKNLDRLKEMQIVVLIQCDDGVIIGYNKKGSSVYEKIGE